MNLRQLELFLAVVDAGGFTAAAGRLGIAQPAVSAALRKLEENLGARLLSRDTRRLALTAQGAAFARHARAVLAQLAASRREIAALGATSVEQVSIGAPAMVAGHLLPRVLDGFLRERPQLRLKVLQGGAEEIAASVLKGDLDLGLIADWRTPQRLATQLLAQQPMVACVPAASPLAERRRLGWAELLEWPLVLFPSGYYQRSRVEDAAARLGHQPRVVVEAESIPLIVELVRRGHGLATLMAAAAEGLPGIRSLALPREATVPIAVCRRAGAPASSAVEALEAYLVQQLSERS